MSAIRKPIAAPAFRCGSPLCEGPRRGASSRRPILRCFSPSSTRHASSCAKVPRCTSCGFLAAYQEVLSQSVPVPVITSSLLQAARLAQPGIVTIDAVSLTPEVLDAAGVPAHTPVQGVEPGCEFQRRILSNDSTLDLRRAEQDVVAAANELVAQHPLVTDIVLECTNMPPYRDAVARATGRPVHDIETLLLRASSTHRSRPT